MRWFGLAILVLLATMSSATMLRGFSSQLVDVTARVEVLLRKEVVPDPAITQETVDAITAGSGVSGCASGDVTPPLQAETGKCNWWVIRLVVTNVLDRPIKDVLVEDEFGPGVEAVILTTVSGEAEKTTAGDHAKVVWCATDVLDGGTCKAGGQLLTGEGGSVELLVFTKLNGEGIQEYATAGVHEINSGATVSLTDAETDGTLESATLPIQVEAVAGSGEESAPVPTPTPAPTPAPTAAPTPAPTAAPTPSPTPPPTATPVPSPIPTPTPTPTPIPTPTPTPTPTPIP